MVGLLARPLLLAPIFKIQGGSEHHQLGNPFHSDQQLGYQPHYQQECARAGFHHPGKIEDWAHLAFPRHRGLRLHEFKKVGGKSPQRCDPISCRKAL